VWCSGSIEDGDGDGNPCIASLVGALGQALKLHLRIAEGGGILCPALKLLASGCVPDGGPVMLAAEAMRLAAVEALAPTASIRAGGPFPTSAREKVFDSQAIRFEDLADGVEFTPTVALYTDDSRSVRAGEGAASTIGFATATLTAVCELSVGITGDGDPYADAMAETDPMARLVLGALCSQVRQTLVRGPTSEPFRRVVKSIEEVRIEPFALPDMGLRWMRSTIRFTCAIADDEFIDAAGLPQPIRRLMEALPPGSYAKAKLEALHAAFLATDRDALQSIRLSTRGDPAVDPAEASVTF